MIGFRVLDFVSTIRMYIVVPHVPNLDMSRANAVDLGLNSKFIVCDVDD